MNRRELLLGGLSLLAGSRVVAPPPAWSQTSDPAARLLAALGRNRLSLNMSDGPAGPGWDWLVQQARDARFTLIGEEHGVAETAQFSASLFRALPEAGYRRMAIELSPVIAITMSCSGSTMVY